MRIKPAPGTYTVTIDGATAVLIITEAGATSGFYHFGAWFPLEWEWFEMSGGPALMMTQPSIVGEPPIQYVGFDDEGGVAVVFGDGTGKEGTYAPAK